MLGEPYCGSQYADEFSKLSRYAPDDVATDAAKQEKFMGRAE